MELWELLDIFIMLTRQLQDDHIDDGSEAKTNIEEVDNNDGMAGPISDEMIVREKLMTNGASHHLHQPQVHCPQSYNQSLYL